MLKDLVEAAPLDGYRVRLRFEDGIEGELDLATIIHFEGVFAPLKDLVRFRELAVHPDLGTIYWPNGADLDPVVLYTRITGAPLPKYEAKAIH
ncbi:MAG: DUF2442 domain-containing protein [Nitrospira sp.]|jgi:hypothetical protein|uniref:DUF2442 domain-containing protein n=1 Tax=Nitrospira sp. ND1 TaxID=1658518 RepID=UPI0009BB3D63|nr:DUF2442 domain-containing protein [Nitrospira sp. ND1]MBK7420707.1 DUF2442 domain-containing protein [Nitrospira sp.]OYT24644.1 MAG: molybdopterin-guanine dinucleotide biosynthesis protein A [Nitrospira sp. UW-LDO-02]MBK7485762.1 DUF2442 domain-containing protein [Nitrospira sp.]MBK8378829.1 DUF2442 domain-containing protein [Nitrospira sp.]MBK9113728.1 DUF2442 domain-containing protein [Nitrospira sp.]